MFCFVVVVVVVFVVVVLSFESFSKMYESVLFAYVTLERREH